jgi:hypothetical protein
MKITIIFTLVILCGLQTKADALSDYEANRRLKNIEFELYNQRLIMETQAEILGSQAPQDKVSEECRTATIWHNEFIKCPNGFNVEMCRSQANKWAVKVKKECN